MNSINPDHVVTLVSPDTLDELITLLELRWPDRRIPAAEFHAMIASVADVNMRVLVSRLGLHRNWYNTREIAELLWERASDENIDYPDE